MAIDFDIVVCPFCLGNCLLSLRGDGLFCEKCERTYLIKDGIPVLMRDNNLDTLLDLDQYITTHPPQETLATNNYNKNWAPLFEKYCKNFDSVLELGAGAGNLTFGLANYSPFERVLCTDVSFKFLSYLLKWIDNKKIHPYIVDANNIPLLPDSLDAVVGHSVLHHFLHYKKVLTDVYALLKDGGVAIFGEPILDAHACASFLASMILAVNERLKIVEFTDKESCVLKVMSRLAGKVDLMRNDPEKLSSLEDKYIFGIQELARLGRSVGYKGVTYVNPTYVVDYEQYIKAYFKTRFQAYAGTDGQIDAFDFVFQCFYETYVKCMGDDYPLNFGFFVFEK